jgi:hypothetical protein
MNVMDGGHDAPGGPVSPRARILLWTLLMVLSVAAVVAIALSVAD